MNGARDYNVIGGLLGLGEFILLEIISEMILPQDVQQFLVVCRKINKLLDHPRFKKIIQSIIKITPVFIIKEKQQGRLKGMKFVHSNKYAQSTIAFEPVICEGIVRFEVIFEHTRFYRICGIADASCSFDAYMGPSDDEYIEKTVRYDN
ncbi:MAG: hypothetical protein EZS28_034811, partial [Streblomastix strix]